jgi:formamidopyrimidine-DNA glycosylase
MPELPEVETIKKYLDHYIRNRKILAIKIFNKKSFRGDKNKIINKKIIEVERKGKILIIKLNNSYDLMIHLKMSGQLIYTQDCNEITRHTRVIFKLNRGCLIFNDLRKFGWIKIIEKNNLNQEINNLGKDALEITFNEFKKICLNSQQKIKLLLMNQNKISGIGNIYANEILFLSKINPFQKANQLNHHQLKKLFQAIKTIIKKAIRHEGTSSRLYLKPDKSKGNYQNYFLVYNKENELCPICRTKIKRVKINNRSTFYCVRCQI